MEKNILILGLRRRRGNSWKRRRE